MDSNAHVIRCILDPRIQLILSVNEKRSLIVGIDGKKNNIRKTDSKIRISNSHPVFENRAAKLSIYQKVPHFEKIYSYKNK
jgi:hypothetical protein